MHILYLPLEFSSFFSAKKLSYPVCIGMVEGFETNRIEHLTVPIMYHTQLWLCKLKELVGGRKFDQVWFEVVHSVIPEDILEWLTSLAPVRVGFVIENMDITPEEYQINSIGTQRRVDNLNQKLPYLTHAMVMNASDIVTFNIPAMHCATSIPERSVRIPNSTSDKAVFYGTLYGRRREWATELNYCLNVNPPSTEDISNLPCLFEQLFATSDYSVKDYSAFYRDWYFIRQGVYFNWINHLHTIASCAMVSLPHHTQLLPGRVIESMAAGKPVVSPLMNNAVDDLFIDGKEILYYSDIVGLVSCLDKLRSDPDLRFYLAEAAIVKVLENHTTEVRVKEILDFVGKTI